MSLVFYFSTLVSHFGETADRRSFLSTDRSIPASNSCEEAIEVVSSQPLSIGNRMFNARRLFDCDCSMGKPSTHRRGPGGSSQRAWEKGPRFEHEASKRPSGSSQHMLKSNTEIKSTTHRRGPVAHLIECEQRNAELRKEAEFTMTMNHRLVPQEPEMHCYLPSPC